MNIRHEPRGSLGMGAQYLQDFIAAYRENEPLWNPRHRDYTKHHVRGICYEALVQKMQETQPDATRDDVVKKINSIRCSFRKEYRKVLHYLQSGQTYTPKLWYYNQLLFLEQETPPPTVDSSDQDNAAAIQSQIHIVEEVEHDDPLADTVEQHSEEEEKFIYQEIKPGTMQVIKRKRQKTTNRRVQEPAVETPKAYDWRTQETHAEIFGRHVAAKLNSLREDQRMFLEKLINDAIFEAELGNLTRECRIIVE